MRFPRRTLLTRLLLVMVVAVSSLGLGACMNPSRATVAFLLASSQAERWEKVDEPVFRQYLEDTCQGCTYVTHTAEQDVDRQASQFQQVLDEGADVVVLNPVDAVAAADLVAGTDVPVIAYDRFVEGAQHFVSADPAEIGRVMAKGLVNAVGRNSRVLMVNGAEGDANAVEIRRAVMEVFESHAVTVVDEVTPTSWSADAAEEFIRSNAGRFPGVDAVLAANDTEAAGVVTALQDLGVTGNAYPFITGQDAELQAVRRLVAGEQGLTVHKQITQMAQRAADLSIDVMGGVEPEGLTDYRGVESVLLEPVAVTRQNIAGTVVRGSVHTVDEICGSGLVRACERLGLR